MSQQIDTIAVTHRQSLGADDQDERAKGTELKHDRGVSLRGGAGVLASGRAHGWETTPRQLLPRSGVRPDASPPALRTPQRLNTTAPHPIDVAPRSTVPCPTVQRQRGPVPPDHPTWGKVFAETVPLVGALAFFGPPVSFLLGPWLLLVLLLIGPFALVLTILLATAAAACLLAMFVALIASPYLLIRHLRARGTVRTKSRAARHLLPKHRVGSGRLALQQPKGLS